MDRDVLKSAPIMKQIMLEKEFYNNADFEEKLEYHKHRLGLTHGPGKRKRKKKRKK